MTCDYCGHLATWHMNDGYREMHLCDRDYRLATGDTDGSGCA